MYTHKIEQISFVNGRYYSFKSIVGTITCSDQDYLLPIKDKEAADNLAARHGCRDIMNLVHFSFTSTIERFSEAMERLLFGKSFVVDAHDAVLTKIIIPALLSGKEPEYRGLDYNILLNYVRVESDAGNIVQGDDIFDLNGEKWIAKVSKILKSHNFKIVKYTNPKTMIKGQAFYFTVTGNNKKTHWTFTPSRQIVTIIE
ncbi:Hypothetical protein HVR_LOCUS608 [uncultured virus]|nr:Hypothetical protein HVR_LOCUS608 [uncultured virus]